MFLTMFGMCNFWFVPYNYFVKLYFMHHHHHHQCLASGFPCTHGSDVSPKIFLLHNCLSLASPTLKPKSFMSLLTHCNHVFLPVPLPTFNRYIKYVSNDEFRMDIRYRWGKQGHP